MKQPFVNATINDRRKGRELHAQTTHCHPLRETVIGNSHHCLPITVKPKPVAEDPMDKIRAEVHKMLAEKPKDKSVPRSRILGLASAVPEPEPVKDYADILTMLLAKK